jgi:hypothetical protein
MQVSENKYIAGKFFRMSKIPQPAFSENPLE